VTQPHWPAHPYEDGPAQPPFRAQSAEDAAGVVLWVAGELDVTATELMDDALSEAYPAPGQRLAVDVSHLAFIDVAGVRLLDATDRRLRGEGRTGLVVRGAPAVVRRVFEILRATALLAEPEPVALLLPGRPRRAGVLELARQAAGLSIPDLFVAYFALGGTAGLSQVAAHLAGDPYALDVHQRQVAVHAVNERLIDLERTDWLLSSSSE
jgi:anti-anti-sigma factor